MNLNEEVQFSFMAGFPNSATATANAVVELAEQLKFDSHRVGEHVAFPVPILDPLLQLSLASAFSENLTFCGVDVQERGARLSAAISALKQLWKSKEVCYQSKFYQLVERIEAKFFHLSITTVRASPIIKTGFFRYVWRGSHRVL